MYNLCVSVAYIILIIFIAFSRCSISVLLFRFKILTSQVHSLLLYDEVALLIKLWYTLPIESDITPRVFWIYNIIVSWLSMIYPPPKFLPPKDTVSTVPVWSVPVVCSLPPPFPGDNLKQTTLSGQPRAVWKSGYPEHCKSWYNPAVFQAIRCSKCRGFAEWPRWEEQKEQIANHYLARVDWTGHKPGKMGRNV